ncbi:MAG: hypothetical protein ACLRM8_07435, partial [Alistipes sp.]
VYTDVRIGEPIPAEVIRMDNNVVIGDQGQESKDEAFWESVRPYRLSDKEKGIYSMVDSVQNVPLYRNIYTLINTVIVGYWNTKYIGIGPYYYKLASFNKLEGSACSRDSARPRPSANACVSQDMRPTARATACSRAAAANWPSTAA